MKSPSPTPKLGGLLVEAFRVIDSVAKYIANSSEGRVSRNSNTCQKLVICRSQKSTISNIYKDRGGGVTQFGVLGLGFFAVQYSEPYYVASE